MKRRILTALIVTICAGLAATPAFAGDTGLSVSGASSLGWPSRSYVLTLPPGAKLDSTEVHVTENDSPVSGITVAGGDASSNRFGVVLVIDASESMHGAPIADAMKAARAFVAQRTPNQPIAVVAFSRTPQTLLPFTTDASEIAAALAHEPALHSGTHIFDAADQAISMLTSAHIKSGSVVLLSDGADTGSTGSLNEVTGNAVNGGVRIFTVGLEGKGFDATTLTDLAQGAGGTYTDAPTSRQLGGIFNQLGVQLANQYVLRYVSPSRAGADVDVQVSVDGYGTAPVFRYRAPEIKDTTASYNPTVWQRLLTSWIALVAVAALCAMLIAYAVIVVVQPGRRAMRRRVTRYVDPDALTQPEDGTPAVTAIAETIYDRTERTLAGKPRWERFKEEVDVAGVSVGAAQLMVVSTIGGIAAGLALAVLTGATALAVVGLAGPIVARAWIDQRAESARTRFAEQLPINLEVLASALRSGHSLTGALKVVIEDASEPSRSEFSRVVNDEQAGMHIDQAFEDTVRRMQNADLRQIAIVAQIQRQAGGNTAEVLDRVTENIRARAELRRMVKTLTAQGRLSRWIVTALPVFLLLAISVLNPGYLHPLFHTTVGVVFFCMASVMVVAGSLLIKKIVKIEL
ncbi:MAG TPA: type II secretion system F family protein [Gaiellales bacterium]|jgi:tight adherence protein B